MKKNIFNLSLVIGLVVAGNGCLNAVETDKNRTQPLPQQPKSAGATCVDCKQQQINSFKLFVVNLDPLQTSITKEAEQLTKRHNELNTNASVYTNSQRQAALTELAVKNGRLLAKSEVLKELSQIINTHMQKLKS